MAGCGGMLGEAFYEQLGDDYELKCTDIDVNEGWLSYLDFRDFEKYRDDVIKYEPDYLFHLGAFTDLEYCELHPEETFETNTESVRNAVAIANESNIPILYISTAGIFDGEKGIYDEWDTPNPLGNYARSKYEGEVYVEGGANQYLICRPGWMMGAGPKKDKKFIQKMMKQLKDGATELFIVNDKLGTPTYTHDFAKNVKLLIDKDCWGLYNMVCEGMTSRLEVAEELLSILNFETEVNIREVSSDFFKEEYFAVRPDSERLMNKKLNDEGLNIMRNWKVALKEYISDYYDNYLNG